jgi:hypothetical protein
MAAALAPWLSTPRSTFGIATFACLMLIANIAALLFAGTLTVWTARDLPGWRKGSAIIRFLLYAAISLTSVWTAFFMSATIGYWLSASA